MDTASERGRRWIWLWGVCYLALVCAILALLLYARRRTLAELASADSVKQWQAWREDVKHQDADLGPVQRRVPKSAEPPALVLMRDYFGVCLAGALLFSTVLYWVIAWLVVGALTPSPSDLRCR
jgi:hypothetical protein